METASFNGFVKTLIYIIAFYYAFKFLARLFLPILIKKAVEKAGQNFQQGSQQNYYNTNNTNSDEIIIDNSKVAKNRETKKVGEYIDFEEID